MVVFKSSHGMRYSYNLVRTMKKIVIFCIVISVFLPPTVQQGLEDPCKSYIPVPNIEERDERYQAADDQHYLDDKSLPPKWYGTSDLRTLLDHPPGFHLQCGTIYPIWRKEKTDNISTMCIQNWNRDCYKKFTIKSTTCGDREIFHLQPPPMQMSAYCFGWLPGEGPPAFYEKPEIVIKLVNTGINQSELEFQCKFGKFYENVLYHTSWFVDEKEVFTSDVQSWGNGSLTKNHTLTESMLKEAGITTVGFEVWCEVSASYGINKTSSKPVLSDHKYVGIKVLNKSMVIRQGESTDIFLEFTTPFGCGYQPDSNCQLLLESHSIDQPGSCRGGLVTSSCETVVKASRWYKPVRITVTGVITNTYGSASEVHHLKLKTSLNPMHQLWSLYDLGSVRIQVMKDTSLIKGKTCYAVNDPHMMTFDGRKYEHQYLGIFTLYQHSELPIEVQIQTLNCRNGHNAFCLCGAAVRAGRTVFEFNRCLKHSTIWSIGYTLCEDGEDILHVERRGGNYKVYFPTGGYADITLSGVFLNIYIYPSVKDIFKSAGLCGNMTGKCSDDFVLRDGNYSTDPTAKARCGTGYVTWRNDLSKFSNSWRAVKGRNLFDDTDHTLLTSWLKQETFCSCSDSTKEDGPMGKVVCTPSSAYKTCKTLPGYSNVHPSRCTIRERRRRRRRSTAIITNPSTPLQSPTELTKDKAREHCKQLFQQSKTAQVCSDIEGVDTNSSIDNCILDIILTGSTMFGEYSVDTVRSKCFHEVVTNPLLQEDNNHTSVGSPTQSSQPNKSIFDIVVEEACPNDCSQKGNCRKGECKCLPDYGGVDCSVNLMDPPVLTRIEYDGHCDMSRDTCQMIEIYGQTFIDNQTTCIIQEYKVTVSEKKQVRKVRSDALVESISSVQCIITTHKEHEKEDQHYVRAYQISITTMKAIYSNSVGLMVYDSRCITSYINGTDFRWTLQGPYCLFEGICIANGTSQPDNKCQICHVSGTARSWRLNRVAESNCSLPTDTTINSSSPSFQATELTTNDPLSDEKTTYTNEPINTTEDSTSMRTSEVHIPSATTMLTSAQSTMKSLLATTGISTSTANITTKVKQLPVTKATKILHSKSMEGVHTSTEAYTQMVTSEVKTTSTTSEIRIPVVRKETTSVDIPVVTTDVVTSNMPTDSQQTKQRGLTTETSSVPNTSSESRQSSTSNDVSTVSTRPGMTSFSAKLETTTSARSTDINILDINKVSDLNEIERSSPTTFRTSSVPVASSNTAPKTSDDPSLTTVSISSNPIDSAEMNDKFPVIPVASAAAVVVSITIIASVVIWVKLHRGRINQNGETKQNYQSQSRVNLDEKYLHTQVSIPRPQIKETSYLNNTFYDDESYFNN